MSQLIDLECPRCGKTQKDAWHNRQICCSCRIEEERLIGRTARGLAWRAVNKALRAGELIRGACETCGASRADAHHDDYFRPLDVRWLCRSHHKLHHSKFGPGKNDLRVEG